MHLIRQTQAITNSTQTFLELTFQPSFESGSGFDLIPKEQELNKERKISRQHRHIVDDNHNINYMKMGNSDILWEKAEDNNWYKWINYTAEKEKWTTA